MLTRLVGPILLVVLLSGCIGPWHPSRVSQICVPEFADRDGWYGGDTASSVALEDGDGGSSIWLFGDSFVERPEAPGRRSYPMVSNTIGVSRCDPASGWTWSPHWRDDDAGGPRAFFTPAPDDLWVEDARRRTGRAPWYWPLAGFTHDGALFVGLLRVEHAEPRGDFRLPFRTVGVDLARVANPADPPADWSISIDRLSDSSTVIPVSAFATAGEHLYAFAFIDRGDQRRPRGLVRWPLAALDDPRSLARAVETRDARGRWWAGLDADRIGVVFAASSTEMSLHRAASGEWIAVDMVPRAATDEDPRAILTVRRGPSLEGPWSVVRRIHVAPSPAPGVGRPYCYAGKGHPQVPADGGLWLTYVCSLHAATPDEDLGVLRALADDGSLYRPAPLLLGAPQPVEAEAAPVPR